MERFGFYFVFNLVNVLVEEFLIEYWFGLQLMVHVRLPLVNREFLMTRVDNELLIREDGECRELLLEAMRYHLAPERRCALSTPRTIERKPKGAESYLFSIGLYFLMIIRYPQNNSLLSKHLKSEVISTSMSN